MVTSVTNIDRMIEQLINECKYLSESDIKFLCEKVTAIFLEPQTHL